MIFREIAFGSREYDEERALRDRELRAPLGLSLRDEDVENERAHGHFGLFTAEGDLVACVLVVPISPVEAKIRQMAVAAKEQGKSHGRALMQNLERELAGRGYRQVWLHARVPVVPFYGKLGFEKQGGEFLEVGIAHQKMIRTLSAAAR